MTFGVLIVLLAVGLNGLLADVVSQPVGYASNFLTTSVGIGDPPQFFDLALTLESDNFFLLDQSTMNPDVDYLYDYIKQLFLPEASMSVNLTSDLCRARYKLSSGVKTADGQYAEDVLTLGGQEFDGFVRFCDLTVDRSDASGTSDDPVKWLMQLPIDGFFGLKPGGENAIQRMTPKSRQLTLWIDQKSTEPDNVGVITLGGKDTSNCKSFKTFPSEDSDRFSAWISKASFNSNTYKDTYSGVFTLQNGTFIVPYEVYSDISNYFGGQINYFYCANYANPPDLKITIYGKEYTIGLKSLIGPYSSDSSTYCSVNLNYSGSSDEDQFVLDRGILGNYCLYLDYDNSIVGLAERK